MSNAFIQPGPMSNAFMQLGPMSDAFKEIVLLTISTFWANSAEDKLITFCLFSKKIGFSDPMFGFQTLCSGENKYIV